MQCPDCSSQLQVIKDRLIDKNEELDIVFCNHCGGFWLDSNTVNKLSFKNIEGYQKRIKSTADNEKLKNEIKKCPECHQDLEQVRAESIPPGTFVYTCKSCHKNWFPKEQLLKFKRAQDAKLAYVKEWQVPLKSTFSILLPLFLVLIVMISLPLTIYLVRVRQASEITAEELINQPSVIKIDKTSVIVSFETDKKTTSRIEYGLDKNKQYTLDINKTPDTFHQITLTNLLPDRIYWYKLQINMNGKSITSSYYFFDTND